MRMAVKPWLQMPHYLILCYEGIKGISGSCRLENGQVFSFLVVLIRQALAGVITSYLAGGDKDILTFMDSKQVRSSAIKIKADRGPP